MPHITTSRDHQPRIFAHPSSRFFRRTPFRRALIVVVLIGALVAPVPLPRRASARGDFASPSHGRVSLADAALSKFLTLVGLRQRSEMPRHKRPLPSRMAPKRPLTPAERAAKVTRIELGAPDELTLESQQSWVLVAVPLDAQGHAVHGLTVNWESSDQQVAFISPDGRVVAGKPGQAFITASVEHKHRSVRVRVVKSRGRFGGRKADSTRYPRTSAATAATSGGQGTVSFIKAAWSPNERRHQPSTSWRAGGSHGSRHASLALRARDDFDRLPDDETPSLYEPANDIGAPRGRTEPGAQTPPAATAGTETPGSDNFTFHVPLVALPGRGIDVTLGLAYNSRLWHKSVDSAGRTHLTYDVDSGWPAPGFRLNYGHLEAQGSGGFTLVAPNGTRHQLVPVPNMADTYEATDGTFIRFHGGLSGGLVTYTDGTRVEYGAAHPPRSFPVRITDRNGNFISISYSYVNGHSAATRTSIYAIQDTMNRATRFFYDASGNLVTILVPGYHEGADRQVVRFYYEDMPVNASFQVEASGPATARVLRRIYFPATRTGYRYDYSSYGMIRRINQQREMTVDSNELTTTGTVTSDGQTAAWTEYDYPASPANLSDAPSYRRRTDDWAGRTSGMPGTGDAPFYTYAVDQAGGISTVTAPDGTVTETQMIVNRGQWNDGLVRETVVKQGDRVLARHHIEWEHDGSFRNYRPQRTDMTDEAGKTRSLAYAYADFNNVRETRELGFDGEELRRTETTYEMRAEWTSRRLVHLPKSITVYPGRSVTPVSRTEYKYDSDTPGATLSRRDDLIMHDKAYNPWAESRQQCGWRFGECQDWGDGEQFCTMEWRCQTRHPYDTATDYRGNLTSITRYPNPSDEASRITDTMEYDIAGNLVEASVDCCRQKTFTYTKQYEYAYAVTETRGDAGQLSTSAGYDFNTGLVRTTTDENRQTTTRHYYPESLRLFRTERPDGGYAQTEYEDGLHPNPDATRLHSFVTTVTSIDATRTTSLTSFMDGRGAVARTFARMPEPDTYATMDVEYDAMGRPLRSSNPYYSGGSASAINPPDEWTTRQYDGLGRVFAATLPDGNTMHTDYAGTAVTSFDPAGRARRRITDALGRLERLDEPDASGNLGSLETPAQSTFYHYDALDNLVRVTQGEQRRYFKYDGLSRMTHERQVEQAAPHAQEDTLTSNNLWSKRIVYDNRSRVTDTFDARNIHTHIQYDGLNRPVEVGYSDGTPITTYAYDEERPGYFNRGRLTAVTTVANVHAPQTVQRYDYDHMGRVAAQTQEVDRARYEMSYTYNLLGQLTAQTYPSGRRVDYHYDAAARLAGVSDASRVYASGLSYAAHGALTSERWGNDALHEMGYNRRLQLDRITLTRNRRVVQQWRHTYGQVEMATGAVDEMKNTGHIGRIEDYRGGIGEISSKRHEQRYGYDSLGRLERASEHGGADEPVHWRVDYDYDRYGNRFQRSDQPHDNYNINFTAVEAGDIDPQTNRFTAGMDYDGAGNVTADAKFHHQRYEYDANSRMRRASPMDSANLTTNLSSSIYNGHGQRVVNTVAGESHTYVYNWMGEVVSEYGAQGWERDRIHRGGQLLATDEAVGICRKTIEQFVVGFYRGALNRAPSTAQYEEWRVRLRQAQQQGAAPLLEAARVFGRTLFESEEYATRQRTDAEFVSDLYWSYLQRAPDQDGSIFWRGEVERGGRSHGLNSFPASIEYRAMVEGLCETGAVTGEVQWVLSDHLGSVRVMTNSAGAVIARRDNLPFGDALRDVGAATASSSAGTASSESSATSSGLWGWHNTIRTLFASMEKDAASGLEHTGWRKYDAWQGRWTSADPSLSSMDASNPQSLNRYSYVGNDPVNVIDPSGLDGITIDTGAPVTVIGYVDSAVRGGTLSSLAGLVGVDGGREWNELLGDVGGGGESGGSNAHQSERTALRGSEINTLRNDLRGLLKNPACASFVKSMLEQLKRDTGRSQHGTTDITQLFDAVIDAKGFHFQMMKGAQASAGGGPRNAIMLITPTNAFADFANRYSGTSASRGLTVIHELLHVAGYGHDAMASAAYNIGGRFEGWRYWKGDFPNRSHFPEGRKGDEMLDGAYSGFFGNIAAQNCGGK